MDYAEANNNGHPFCNGPNPAKGLNWFEFKHRLGIHFVHDNSTPTK